MPKVYSEVMKYVIVIAVAIAIISVFFIGKKSAKTPASNVNTVVNTAANSDAQLNLNSTSPPVLANSNTEPINANTTPTTTPSVVIPIANFFNRITKKPFGIYITPKTSPVQPEKFKGYHTGADAETTTDEKNIDIPIQAIANGTVVFAGHVNGYGGVIIIEHNVNGEKITALYGHLRIASFKVKVKDKVHPGDQIAVLGTGYSSETDGERKHLHLGILKGYVINYKGYVPTQSGLSPWEDPVVWLHAHGA